MTTRTGLGWGLIAVATIAALAWGWSVDRVPVPPRPADQTIQADAAWYAALPLDASAATAAYLARITPETRARGEAYSDTRLRAFALRLLTLLVATAVIVASGLMVSAGRWTDRRFSRPLLRDAAVAIAYFVALFALSLPAEVYATYVRPHRFGFSNQPFVSWLQDLLVNWGVMTGFTLVGVLLIYGFMRRRPWQWVGVAVGVYAALRILFALLSPNLIEPLTNDFRPLADGPQKEQISALARANGIDDVAIVVGNASRQTRLLNAHVSGFGATARISVDDNTLRQTSDPMLRFVIAHEIGHFVLGHDFAFALSDTLVMAIGFVLIAWALRTLVRRYGPRFGIASVGDIASIPLFWGLILSWGIVSAPIHNAISRYHEMQADRFGLNASQAPHGVAEFMIHDADVVRLQPTALEMALFYTHPSPADRVATAMRWREQMARLAPLSDTGRP